jgi:hypothetical protein
VQTATAEKIDKPGDAVLRCELRGAGKRSPDTNSAQAEKSAKEIGEAVFIEIVEKTGELVKITVRDPGGVNIEFQFTNWVADPPVEDSLFRFRAPPGVAIVNGELPEGNSGVSP